MSCPACKNALPARQRKGGPHTSGERELSAYMAIEEQLGDALPPDPTCLRCGFHQRDHAPGLGGCSRPFYGEDVG